MAPKTLKVFVTHFASPGVPLDALPVVTLDYVVVVGGDGVCVCVYVCVCVCVCLCVVAVGFPVESGG